MKIRNEKNQKRRLPNRQKLTPLLVDKVAPGDDRVRIWDTGAPGLVLIVEPSGAKSLYAYYRRNRRPRWHRLGAVGGLGLSDAREAVRHLNAKLTLDPAYDPQAEKLASQSQGTVADLVERYIAEHLDGKKSGKQGASLLRRNVVPQIGRLPAAGVQKSDIRSLRNRPGAESTRGQVMANLSAMFNWSIRNDCFGVTANPASGIEQRKAKARERVLSDSELPLFWHSFGEAGLLAARALRMILFTGQRPGEVRHMRFQDIEIGAHQFTDDNGRGYTEHGAWWTLPGDPTEDGWPGTKNTQTHRVWLLKPALQIIEEIQEERSPNAGSPFVFVGRAGKPIASLDGSMRRICQALEVEKPDKVTPHDLRRTHGTTITSLGFTRDQMNRIQNHREGGIGSVYDRHSYSHEARLIQEAVGERILTLVYGERGSKVIDLRR